MPLCFLFSHLLLCSLQQYAVMLATRPILVFGIISQSFSTAYIYAIISWTNSLSALPLFLSIMFRALLSFDIMFVQISCLHTLFECFTFSYSLHFRFVGCSSIDYLGCSLLIRFCILIWLYFTSLLNKQLVSISILF
jgi:hypothetical protein